MEFDETRELEELKHRNKMKEIAFEGRQDRMTEDLKAKNAKKIEWHKIGGMVAKGVIMAGVWFGLTCLADRIEVPRRNVPRDK